MNKFLAKWTKLKRRCKSYYNRNKDSINTKLLIVGLGLLILLLLLLSIYLAPEKREKIPRHLLQLIEENENLLTLDINTYIGYEDYVTEQEIADTKNYEVKSLKIQSYRVKKGETLGGIAQKFKLDLGTLISFNNITDVRKVREGSELQIPSSKGIWYTVKSGDSLERIANRNNSEINSILDYNNITSDVIRAGQKLFLPDAKIDRYTLDKAMGRLFVNPAVGRLTSPYGYRIDPFTGLRRHHNGIDIANKLGTPIVATMAGKVTYTDNLPKGYGRIVVIRHANGYESLYAHLSKILVKPGDWIEQGERVGLMGSTGRSTGSHLHFTLLRNNVTLNPKNYVNY